ncbi:MAG TPA: peptidoglycan-binding domain-containing protein, partial [Nitrolancea sp.]
MELQGRDLKIELTGNDVRLLQRELAQLGFAISADEQGHALFGPTTRDAVLQFQKEHRVDTNGIVDAATAKLINSDIAAVSFSVTGTVYSPDRAGVGGLQIEIVDKNI